MIGSGPMYGWMRTLYRQARKYLPSAVRPIILAYHIITEESLSKRPFSVEKDKFRQHLEVLKQNYNVMSLAELGRCIKKGRIPENAAVITFDDNYQEHLNVALPVLREAKVPATVFICSGSIESENEHYWEELERLILLPPSMPNSIELNINGKRLSWHLDGEEPANSPMLDFRKPNSARQKAYLGVHKELRSISFMELEAALQSLRAQVGDEGNARVTHRLMTLDQLVELGRSQWIEIGGHTSHHYHLASMPEEIQRNEIVEDKRILEGWLQQPIHHFAYPFGGAHDINAETKEFVHQAGYQLAVSTEWDPVGADCDCFFLPRLMINNWTGEDFYQKIKFLGF
jgi:peptidoglycan/xylan/chitin deacetylase (PgdA/CDA1 family)